LRRADQLHWMRVLIAENDNLSAAVRWAVGQRDADLALRLAGALGYYWFLRGRRTELQPLAEAVLGLAWPGWQGEQGAEGPASASKRPQVAAEHAWAVLSCVIVAIGQSWDVDRVRTLLLAAIEAAESAAEPPHPMMVLTRPLIAQFDVDYDAALAMLGPALESSDPWVAALARTMRGGIACSQGRLADAAADGESAERTFRELGERWGIASALVQRGYAAGLQGDRTTEVAALNEAAILAHEMSAEDDCADLLGQLALSRMATGEFDAARADLERAQAIAERIGHDATWLQAIGADLERLAGDLAGARASYDAALLQLGERSKPFQGLRASALTGLALLSLAEGNLAEAADGLGAALRIATVSGGAMGVAAVLEATAAFLLADGTDGADGHISRAERAATLLGAAHGVRGGADAGHPDLAAATADAVSALGQPSFDGSYASGHNLSCDEAISLASGCLNRGARASMP
jgi:tetratricopeptide (TPR) repeat protein